ncbi:MAG TPA: ADP-ribosylglycohydrolase family protein [Solirubrobacteraceae bacterium]|nr:ADP-ribosylglycohydrolase family protein [Solirubrobacteraceae bacterium]
MHDVLDLRAMVGEEIIQRRESGYAIDDVAPSAAAIEGASEDELREFLSRLGAAPRSPGWPYEEPSELAAIEAAQPPVPARARLAAGESSLGDRILGAWLGRCAGCALGKPVEIWPRAAIRRYLEALGAYPLAAYVPPPPGRLPAGLPELNPSWPESTRGRIAGVPRDDDVDYTILGLHILETHGVGFSTDDVAAAWLRHLPFLQVYTAERAAYRNLIHGLRPPDTATHVNPFREWIGAQIRVDAYAYARPGDPAGASRLAFADARLSHTANGLYGAMWAAALIAASFAEPAMPAALDSALAVVPVRSRLAEALAGVRRMHADGLGWEEARDELERRHGSLSPVHTINNAAVVAAALLWGDGDFGRTVGLAVQGGWDTDCNGATAGSAYGAMHGSRSLPRDWTDPLDDRVRTAVYGFDGARISDLAERTLRVALEAAAGRRG